VSVLLSAVLARPSYAAHWQELGNMPDSLDKVYVDTDSAELEDGFRIVRLMVVYPSPRTDKNNKTMDSYIQRTAIDCDKKMYYGIQTSWYRDGKQVVASPSDADWKTKTMHHFTDSSLSQRLQTTVCSLPIPTKKNPSGEVPPGPQSAAPARRPQTFLQGENLLFAPPLNFKIGYYVDRNSMTEWIPNGQTAENWTEMLTVQIFRNLKDVSPAAFLQNVGTMYLNGCPGTPKDTINTGHVNGYVVSMLKLKCPRNPGTGKPETTVFRVIKGKDALYSVQLAWRTAPSEDATQALSRSTVCDTRNPDHPCPSLNAVAPLSQPKTGGPLIPFW
jgi:hypothetical protein